MAFIPGFTGLNFGLAPILQERLGLEINPTSTLIVVVLVTFTQLVINLVGVKIAAKINNAAAFVAELGLSIVLTIILLVVGFVTNPVQDLSFLTTSSVQGSGFTGALLMSGLLAIWVLTGFEGAADLAEETKLAKKQVPRAVIAALIVSLTIGFFMIVALTINIGSLREATGAEVPITHILRGALTIGAVIYASAHNRLSTTTSFSLGAWATPVRWTAFLWSLFVVGELVIPEANRQTALMAGIFFVIAAIWYATVLRAGSGGARRGFRRPSPAGKRHHNDDARGAAAPRRRPGPKG
ncbi:hypothetical protein Acor_27190 [Acrocarpospora corrugata]|uniref:Amino acid permease/ SLC12A domain-containing protein n=1 Tax=Acrocarpospora corrugata TaxID=35763 RepID=A0A5M3VV37_9ACTN|nr:amino acid permease [Acrocarpospora corrugata]GES00655.1 hypothetical protein Acor_27190 [Acrocarpospora corrugata]